MTIRELYSRHAHDSRARRLLGHFGEAQSALEQLAQRLRDEGLLCGSDRVRALVASLEHLAAVSVTVTTSTGERA